MIEKLKMSTVTSCIHIFMKIMEPLLKSKLFNTQVILKQNFGMDQNNEFLQGGI